MAGEASKADTTMTAQLGTAFWTGAMIVSPDSAGQTQIEQQDVGLVLQDQLQRLDGGSATRDDFVAGVGEDLALERPHHRVIVADDSGRRLVLGFLRSHSRVPETSCRAPIGPFAPQCEDNIATKSADRRTRRPPPIGLAPRISAPNPHAAVPRHEFRRQTAQEARRRCFRACSRIAWRRRPVAAGR